MHPPIHIIHSFDHPYSSYIHSFICTNVHPIDQSFIVSMYHVPLIKAAVTLFQSCLMGLNRMSKCWAHTNDNVVNLF